MDRFCPSVEDLAEQLAVAALKKYHHAPLDVTIRFSDGARPLTIPVDRIVTHPNSINSSTPPPLMVPPTSEPEESASNGQEPKFSPCISDILAVLEKAKRPLSTTRILEALAKAGKEHSPRTISEYLSLMVKDGTLDNPGDAHPRGYRLPEWTSDED